LANAKVGDPYTPTVTVSGDADGQYFWQKTGGNLPPGLDWAPQGNGGSTLSFPGTPTTGGRYSGLWVVYPDGTGQCPSTAANYTIPVPYLDVSVSQSATPSQAKVGSDLTYFLHVTNISPDYFDAHEVTVTDTLPGSMTFKSAAWAYDTPPNTEQNCSGGGVVSCEIPVLEGPNGTNRAATVTIVVRPTEPGLINNEAYVSTSDYDQNHANDSSSLEVQVDPVVADLSVGIVAPGRVTAGKNVEHLISVQNNGADTASHVKLQVTFPAEHDFRVTSISGPCSDPKPLSSSGSREFSKCKWPSLAKGLQEVVTLTGHYFNKGKRDVVGLASSAASDPNKDNNLDSKEILVDPLADLSGRVTRETRDDQGYSPGEHAVLIEVGVTNHGPSVAEDVKIIVQWSGPVRLERSDDCEQQHDGAICKWRHLKRHDHERALLYLKVVGKGGIKVHVQVRSSTPDPNPENNKDSLGPI
jgi:uncharacterized repeat protein (TIGR01451 family)